MRQINDIEVLVIAVLTVKESARRSIFFDADIWLDQVVKDSCLNRVVTILVSNVDLGKYEWACAVHLVKRGPAHGGSRALRQYQVRRLICQSNLITSDVPNRECASAAIHEARDGAYLIEDGVLHFNCRSFIKLVHKFDYSLDVFELGVVDDNGWAID